MNKRQKKKQLKMRNKKLIKNYPFLLPRNVFSGKLHHDYNYEYTRYDDIDEGWKIGFGKFLLEDLKQALIETNYLNEFKFFQIKEKYGQLCLYTNGVPKMVYDVIDKYEFISQYVCINCGSPHACVVNDYGWYLPLCKECWDKNNRSREKDGLKIIPYEEVANKRNIGLPYSYTTEIYVNGKTEKVVHNIGETTMKIVDAYKKRKKKEWAKKLSQSSTSIGMEVK